MSGQVSQLTPGAAPLPPVLPDAPPPRARPRRSRHRPAWEEPPSTAGAVSKAVVLAVVVLAVVFPLYTVVLTSLSTQAETLRAGGLVTVPGELTLNAYTQILSGGVVTRAALVSVGVTAVGTVLSTVVSVLAAYGLSRPGSYLHRPILFVFLITMFFGAGLIPTYLLVRKTNKIGRAHV